MTGLALTPPPRLAPPGAGAPAWRPPRPDALDPVFALRRLVAPVGGRLRAAAARAAARAAGRLAGPVAALSDARLAAEWRRLAGLARRGRAHRPRRLAVAAEAARRALGLTPHAVQLMAAQALAGRCAVEMATGEGKTLVTALAAALQAAEGWPVHVITANDYLAERDAETMRPLFDALSLRVGAIAPGAPPEARRAVYAADVVYASAKEVAFDHLRDRIAFAGISRSQLRLRRATGAGPLPVTRGLFAAIVDEADSVMIDEARTPLIISGPAGADGAAAGPLAGQAVALARRLREGADFEVDRRAERPVTLSAAGLDRVAAEGARLGGVWRGRRRARDLAEKALHALHLLRRDVDYIVRDGAVAIVDDYTGRVSEDRMWSDGLHQMVEAKEGLAPSEERRVAGRLTFQRFLRRYRRLSGLSGTLAEVSGELAAVYGLSLVRVPTHRPARRTVAAPVIHANAAAKWAAVAAAAARMRAADRPTLVGVRSVEAAAAAAEALRAAGLMPLVLSAAQDEAEAAVVAAAGAPGAVTVATNMAGRGTDIRLAPEAEAAGGLAVILAERHDAGRIDRQLMGRCARQGQPGAVEIHLAADDALLGAAPPRRPALADFDRAQGALEARHRRERYALERLEEALDDMTAFAGGLE